MAGDPTEEEFVKKIEERRQSLMEDNAPLILSYVNQLERNWADFHLYIVSPTFEAIHPPVIIPPEKISGREPEYVYPIVDYGFRFSTSKGSEMYSAGMSMCKLYFTIEKIIFLLIERLKERGVSPETEVQIGFEGFLSGQRKAFESVINLSFNVVVSNFDPGDWGEKYLAVIKRLADLGYGYPKEAPRDYYRNSYGSSPSISNE